ncbi:MAG: hypothetical protein ACLPG5_12030, partial [Acidocella sp.]
HGPNQASKTAQTAMQQCLSRWLISFRQRFLCDAQNRHETDTSRPFQATLQAAPGRSPTTQTNPLGFMLFRKDSVVFRWTVRHHKG